MKFKFRHAERLVGLFVFLSILALAAGGVMIAFSKKLFVETYPFRTLLSDAGGLSTSTPLNFKGYQIGRVKKYFLDADNYIDVQLAVYKEYLGKVTAGSAIFRQSNPVTGETSLVLLQPKFHSISPARGEDVAIGDPLPVNSLIPSLDTLEGQRLLADNMVEKSGDSVSILFDEAKVFFTNLRTEFKLKEDSFRQFFEKLGDVSESLSRNREIFDHLNRLLNPESGPVFETVERIAKISSRLDLIVGKLDQLMGNYKEPDGLMLKMLGLDKSEVRQVVVNINNNLTAIQQMLASIRTESPMLAELMEKTRKTLEAVNNNPLLRGGISKEPGDTGGSRKKRVDIE